MIKHCALVLEQTISLIYCNTAISECFDNKFLEFISTEQADRQHHSPYLYFTGRAGLL